MTQSKAVQGIINEYHDVFNYSINCILQSQMLLDEDIEILTYYWHENAPESSKYITWPLPVFSSLCATLAICTRINHYETIAITLTSSCIHLYLKWRKRKLKELMKDNTKNLIEYLKLHYKLNRVIIEHFQKRNSAISSLGSSTRKSLFSSLTFESANSFLILASKHLVEVLEKLIYAMAAIANSIDATEINSVYSVDWNLGQYKVDETKDSKYALINFEKLNEVYILITSNFLMCLGLSICTDLWKGTHCDVKYIFRGIISDLLISIETNYTDLNSSFQNMRFTLNSVSQKVGKPRMINHRIQQPLLEFLRQMQLLFELGKVMEENLEKESLEDNIKTLTQQLDDMNNQFAQCSSILTGLGKILHAISTKVLAGTSDSTNIQIKKISTIENKEPNVAIHFDDPDEFLVDEEYNLSIHGSDDEDVILDSKVDYAELIQQVATQKLMIQELNNKLQERRIKKGIHIEDVTKQEKKPTELPADVFIPPAKNVPKDGDVPLPPPIPANLRLFEEIPKLQHNQAQQSYIAEAVKSYASQLNRTEEVFGLEPEDFDATEETA